MRTTRFFDIDTHDTRRYVNKKGQCLPLALYKAGAITNSVFRRWYTLLLRHEPESPTMQTEILDVCRNTKLYDYMIFRGDQYGANINDVKRILESIIPKNKGVIFGINAPYFNHSTIVFNSNGQVRVLEQPFDTLDLSIPITRYLNDVVHFAAQEKFDKNIKNNPGYASVTKKNLNGIKDFYKKEITERMEIFILTDEPTLQSSVLGRMKARRFLHSSSTKKSSSNSRKRVKRAS